MDSFFGLLTLGPIPTSQRYRIPATPLESDGLIAFRPQTAPGLRGLFVYYSRQTELCMLKMGLIRS